MLAGDESGFEFITASFIQGSGLGPASYNVFTGRIRPSPTVTDGNEMFKFVITGRYRSCHPRGARNIDSRATEIQMFRLVPTRNNLNLNCNKSYEIVFRKPKSRGTQSVVPEFSRSDPSHQVSEDFRGHAIFQWKFLDWPRVERSHLPGSRYMHFGFFFLSNGMSEKNLQTIFLHLCHRQLTYASPAWWGFANADVIGRIHAFIRRSIKAG